MARSIIKDRANLFLESIKDLTQREKGKRCKAEVLSLKKEYSLSYVQSSLTYYRELSKGLGLDINRYLTVGYIDKAKLKSSYLKKVSNQHKELTQIVDYEGMVQKAIKMLDSEKYSELVCALCFLTGRRMAEILKTAKFSSYKKSDSMLSFRGQLKKRENFGVYPVYTIGKSADKCKVALDKVRDKIEAKKMTIEQINRKYEKTVNSKCMLEFNCFLGRCSAHDLRKAYATICTSLYKKPNQTTNSFLASILGHGSDDLTTANSYQKYYI
jgi:hypothetical protein